MNIERYVIDLAYAVRRALRPHIGMHASKVSVGKTVSGDEEFAIDEVAEHVIEDFIAKHDLPVAYYSEGRGLVEFGRPEYLLVIDPIDGTRPAMVGIEGGVVSIAAAPYSTEATLSDVMFGCILELKTDRLLTATRGGAARIREGEIDVPVNLSLTVDLDRISWSFELAGRPARLIAQVLSPLIDRSSIRGGVFVISSTAFSLTRLVTGQFDAAVDVGNRILRDYPQFRDEFVRAGLGRPMWIFPYDIAAATLIAETAGCHVTDAYGNPLGDMALLDTSDRNVRSLVAASNPVLHERLLAEIDSRIKALGSDL